MTARNRSLLFLGLAVSALFLFLAFRGLHPEAFIDSLGAVDPLGLLLGAVVYFGGVVMIAWRWQFLLRSLALVPLAGLARLVCIGYMGNNVYPFRAGEALRIFLLRRNHGVPMAGATTVVIVERVFDGVVMLTFIVVALLFIDVESAEIRAVFSFAAPLFFVALAVFFAAATFHQQARHLAGFILSRLPARLGQPLARLAYGLLDGLAALRSPQNLLGAVVFSYASWMVEALVYWIVLLAFGLEVGYAVALLTVGTVNLAGLIPSSPGQIGVYEFFVSLVVMATASVSQDQALAFAIVVHIVIWLPVTLVGFALLAQQGLGWSAIGRAARDEQAPTQVEAAR
ncbi:MAG: flippase-like domain-containing protein [Anaerolineae bacterium]|nr:flippase-like domain-containing protein [Anaerolineae bacterium]MDW8172970.1 lysylphosphatidylglycerol synthase transmembrane domain-containing protein [Anaerolineae bacterium]